MYVSYLLDKDGPMYPGAARHAGGLNLAAQSFVGAPPQYPDYGGYHVSLDSAQPAGPAWPSPYGADWGSYGQAGPAASAVHGLGAGPPAAAMAYGAADFHPHHPAHPHPHAGPAPPCPPAGQPLGPGPPAADPLPLSPGAQRRSLCEWMRKPAQPAPGSQGKRGGAWGAGPEGRRGAGCSGGCPGRPPRLRRQGAGGARLGSAHGGLEGWRLTMPDAPFSGPASALRGAGRVAPGPGRTVLAVGAGGPGGAGLGHEGAARPGPSQPAWPGAEGGEGAGGLQAATAMCWGRAARSGPGALCLQREGAEPAAVAAGSRAAPSRTAPGPE